MRYESQRKSQLKVIFCSGCAVSRLRPLWPLDSGLAAFGRAPE